MVDAAGSDARSEHAAQAATQFRFFPATGSLAHFVEYFYTSEVPSHFAARVEGTRLPEVEAQLVFAIEEGEAFPGGTRLAGRLRASLFLQPAHLQMIPIPGRSATHNTDSPFTWRS